MKKLKYIIPLLILTCGATTNNNIYIYADTVEETTYNKTIKHILYFPAFSSQNKLEVGEYLEQLNEFSYLIKQDVAQTKRTVIKDNYGCIESEKIDITDDEMIEKHKIVRADFLDAAVYPTVGVFELVYSKRITPILVYLVNEETGELLTTNEEISKGENVFYQKEGEAFNFEENILPQLLKSDNLKGFELSQNQDNVTKKYLFNKDYIFTPYYTIDDFQLRRKGTVSHFFENRNELDLKENYDEENKIYSFFVNLKQSSETITTNNDTDKQENQNEESSVESKDETTDKQTSVETTTEEQVESSQESSKVSTEQPKEETTEQSSETTSEVTTEESTDQSSEVSTEQSSSNTVESTTVSSTESEQTTTTQNKESKPVEETSSTNKQESKKVERKEELPKTGDTSSSLLLAGFTTLLAAIGLSRKSKKD